MILNQRCVTCNKVSSEAIETNIGDYLKKSFVPDPVNPLQTVCEECKALHEELMHEYEVIDHWKKLDLGDEHEDDDNIWVGFPEEDWKDIPTFFEINEVFDEEDYVQD